jgi:glycerol 2-dehydrogenase (NADP+)
MTEFWRDLHHDVNAALQISLEKVSLDYVDIFLMHWPWASTPDGKPLRIHQAPTFVDIWKQMEELVGPRCRSIGLGNFTMKTLDTLLKHASVLPAVNQFELHPLNPCFKLVRCCQSKGMHPISWR